MSEESPVTLMQGEEIKVNESPSIAGYLTRNLYLSLISFGILPLLFAMKSSLVVTNERAILSTGIIRTNTKEYRIEDIKQISTSQSLIEKLLGCGNVQFSTGATANDIVFNGLSDYESVTNTIRNLQRES